MNEIPIPAGAVVVGVDGSDAARAAMAWAVRLASDEHRPMVLVNALDDVWAQSLIGASHPVDRDLVVADLTRESRILVDREIQLAHRLAPDVDVLSGVGTTGPREVLLEAARRGAAVIVLGSHGRGPLRSLMLGSVSEAVARSAECTVVVVRPGRAGQSSGRGILVGVDGSPESVPVVEAAFRIASERGLRLTVLHVWSDWRDAVGTSYGAPPPAREAPERDRLGVSGSMGALRDAFPDVTVRTTYASGPPAMRLVAESSGFDLLVIGRYVRGPVGRLVHGSITASVVEHATCPVMVVPLVADRGTRSATRTPDPELADAG